MNGERNADFSSFPFATLPLSAVRQDFAELPGATGGWIGFQGQGEPEVII